MFGLNRYIVHESANVKVCQYQIMISDGLFEETNEQQSFSKYLKTILQLTMF